MKKTLIALVAAAALASTAAASQATKPTTAPKSTATKAAPAAKAAPAKAHTMAAEVVSVDAAAKTITVKGANGQNETLTATGNAVAELAKVTAGEKVHVTVEGTNVSKITKASTKSEKSKK